MNTILFTSYKNRKDNDAVAALKYCVDNLEISACILDGEIVNEVFEQMCSELSVPVYTRDNMLRSITAGTIQRPEIGLAYHYHSMINKDLLQFPKNGIINFHPAPLPEHKGVSACTYAILHKYTQWGVTAHYMDEGFDTGPIIKVQNFNIDNCDCSSIVLQRINYRHLLNLFKEIVDILASGVIPASKQQEETGHYYSRKHLEEDKVISVTDSKDIINHKIKSMWFPPYHGANITIDGEKFTLVNERILEELEEMYSLVLEDHKELFGGLE